MAPEMIAREPTMRIETLVRDTLELKGSRVAGVEGDTEEIVVRIVPDRRYAPRCGQCGGKGRYRDRRRERRYRHVPLWGIPVTLVYTLRRVRCKRCGGARGGSALGGGEAEVHPGHVGDDRGVGEAAAVVACGPLVRLLVVYRGAVREGGGGLGPATPGPLRTDPQSAWTRSPASVATST